VQVGTSRPPPWRLLLATLLLWQLAVFLLTALGIVARWGSGIAELASEHREFLVSLLAPTNSEIREAAAAIEPALGNAEQLPTEFRPVPDVPEGVPWYQQDQQRIEAVYANLLAHLGRGELDQAAKMAEIEKLYGLQDVRETILELRSLDSFELRMKLADKLVRVWHGEYAPPLHCGLFGWTLELATSDAQRAAVAYRLGQIRQTLTFQLRALDTRQVQVAIVRLSSSADGERRARAGALARLGDMEASQEHHLLAAELFHEAAKAHPGGPEWGRATFNRAYLLRCAGFPVAARTALASIFDSQVNDHEPGGRNLMETNRNYRHRSALETAACFEDTHNFVMAYYWQTLAVKKYRFVSWCGTCRWGADRALSRQLRWSSLKAGPLFMAGNLVCFPLRNLGYWAGGIAACFVVARWRRRRACKLAVRRRPPTDGEVGSQGFA
jgi:hypothetical protein